MVNDGDKKAARDFVAAIRRGGLGNGLGLATLFAAHREQAERDTIKAVVDWLRGGPIEFALSEYPDWVISGKFADALETGAWKQ